MYQDITHRRAAIASSLAVLSSVIAVSYNLATLSTEAYSTTLLIAGTFSGAAVALAAITLLLSPRWWTVLVVLAVLAVNAWVLLNAASRTVYIDAQWQNLREQLIKQRNSSAGG